MGNRAALPPGPPTWLLEQNEKVMKTWRDLARRLIEKRHVASRQMAGETRWEFAQSPAGAVTVSVYGALSSEIFEYPSLGAFATALVHHAHWGAWMGEGWAKSEGFVPGFAK